MHFGRSASRLASASGSRQRTLARASGLTGYFGNHSVCATEPGLHQLADRLRCRLAERLSSYVDTAVDVDRLSRNVVAVHYEVAHGPGDLGWFAETAEWDLFLELLLRFLGDAGDHIGLDKPWADGVHGDPGLGQLRRRGLGETEQPGLGRRVVSLADFPRLADEGAHVDDLAPALLGHVRQHRVEGVEGAVEVYLDDLVPIIHGELLQRTVDVDARVVDQDVYTIVLFYRLVYELLGRFLALGVVDHDFGPPAGQLLRYGRAQTPARPGHDDNGLVQCAHLDLPLPVRMWSR